MKPPYVTLTGPRPRRFLFCRNRQTVTAPGKAGIILREMNAALDRRQSFWDLIASEKVSASKNLISGKISELS